VGRHMSFYAGRLCLFLGVFFAVILGAVEAYAEFPDLGVVGEHRLMTVVGFAQQDFYFDLFKNGGLQTLALTFALIGGLLILLIPKNHNFMTIFCYLFLVFILIVGPNPSDNSLFFYPLGSHQDAWDCPVPPNDALSMEIVCKSGVDASIAGNISDALPTRITNNMDQFGAFTPQLVAIHFFTAIERTLLQALWGGAENQTTPGDVTGIYSDSALLSDTVKNNQNIQYYEAVYSEICPVHDVVKNMADFASIPASQLKLAAEDTFTYSDAIRANEVYYSGFADKRIYPVRAATARLHQTDYAKSIVMPDGTGNPAYEARKSAMEAVIASINVDSSIQALIDYKTERNSVSTTRVGFPYRGTIGNNKNHIFNDLLLEDNDYVESSHWLWGTKEAAYEPDPYNYHLEADGTLSVGGTAVTGTQTREPITPIGRSVLWGGSGLVTGTVAGQIFPDSTGNYGFIPSAEEFRRALSVFEGADGRYDSLNSAMANYPVQLYIPYVTARKSGVPSVTLVGSGTLAHRGLLPRSYGAIPNLGGVTTAGGNNFNPAVQSCLDLAALIWSRKFYALEEAGLMPTDSGSNVIDFRVPLTISQGQHLLDPSFLNSSSDPNIRKVHASLAESARMMLMREGCIQRIDSTTGASTWSGCGTGEVNIPDNSWGTTEYFCKNGGMGCSMSLWAQSFAGDMKSAWGNAQTGNFSSITASPNGATSYGGVNSYSAAVGSVVVKVGLSIASAVQGFVYGAYMKLMPVIISYGLALALFMTPFAFLMGIAVPMQASAVLVAPIVAVAFLKTVSIALILIDHAFVSLMFWVEGTNVGDPELYKAMLVMAHLTASVSLFSLAGMLLFGMKDSGSFVKHLTSMDKAGQVSFQEAMAYGAAPIVAARTLAKGTQAVGRGTGSLLEKGQSLSNAAEEKLDKVGLGGAARVSSSAFGGAAGALATVSALPGASMLLGDSVRDGYMGSANARTGRASFRRNSAGGGLSQRLGESDPDDMALNESKDSAKRAYAKMTKSGTAASKLKAPIEKDANSERGLSSYHDEMQDKIAKMWIQAKGSMKNAQPNINSSFNSMNQHMSDMHQAGTLDQHYSKQQNLKTGAAQYHVSQEALKAQGMTDEMISKLKWENVQVKGSDGKMITKKMHELESREGLNAAPKKSSMNTEDWVT
jgi:hypothetical protein